MIPVYVAQLGMVLAVFVMLLLSRGDGLLRAQGGAFIQQRTGPTGRPEGPPSADRDVIKLMFKESLRPSPPTRSSSSSRRSCPPRPRSRPSRSSPSARRPPSSAAGGAGQAPGGDVNVAVLVVFAITSISVYGIVLAGWSSNSKYSLLERCGRRRR